MPPVDPTVVLRSIPAEGGQRKSAPQAPVIWTDPGKDQKTAHDMGVADANLGLSAQSGDRAERTFQNTKQNTTLDNVRQLRQEYTNDFSIKSYETSWPRLMHGLKTEETPGGDNALIYDYAKIMDSLTGVREGEARSAEQSAAFVENLVAQVKKNLDSGGSLPESLRQSYRHEMNQMVYELSKVYDQKRTQYSTIAQRNQMDPYEVVGEHVAQPGLKEYNETRAKLGWDPKEANLSDLHLSDQHQSFPAEYQQLHDAWINQHIKDGNLNAEDYLSMRRTLDHQFAGELKGAQTSPDLKSAQELMSFYQKHPDAGIGKIPVEMPELSAVDKLRAQGAKSTTGAFARDYMNSLGVGIPEAMGDKTGYRLSREASPTASALGDVVGGIVPVAAAERGMASLGKLGGEGLLASLGREGAANAGYSAGREATSGGDLGDIAKAGGVGGAFGVAGSALVKGAAPFLSREQTAAVQQFTDKNQVPAANARGILPVDEATPREFQALGDTALQAEAQSARRGVSAWDQHVADLRNADDAGAREKLLTQDVIRQNQAKQRVFIQENSRSLSGGADPAVLAKAEEMFPTDPAKLAEHPDIAKLRALQDVQAPNLPPRDMLATRAQRLEDYTAQPPSIDKISITPADPTFMQRMGLSKLEESVQSLPGISKARLQAIQSYVRNNSERALGRVGIALPKDTKTGFEANDFIHKALGNKYEEYKPLINGPINDGFREAVAGLQRKALDNPLDTHLISNWQKIDHELQKFSPTSKTFDGQSYQDLTSKLRTMADKWRSSAASGPAEHEAALLADQASDAAHKLVIDTHPGLAEPLTNLNTAYKHHARITDATTRAMKDEGIYTPGGYQDAISKATPSDNQLAGGGAFDHDYSQAGIKVFGTQHPGKPSIRETNLVANVLHPAVIASLAAGYIPPMKQISHWLANGNVGKIAKAIADYIPDSVSSKIPDAMPDAEDWTKAAITRALQQYTQGR